MKTEHEPARDPADDLLDRALQAVLAQPVPQDVRQRVIETAVAWRQDSIALCPPQHGRPPLPARPMPGHSQTARTVRVALSSFRGRGRLGLAALAAFVAAAAAVSWLLHPNESWAQVAEALRKRPWCLGKFTTPDGELHEDWMSFSGDVSAQRGGGFVRFSDHRLNLTYVYDSKERTLTRRWIPSQVGRRGQTVRFRRFFSRSFAGLKSSTLRFRASSSSNRSEGLSRSTGARGGATSWQSVPSMRTRSLGCPSFDSRFSSTRRRAICDFRAISC